MQLFRKLTRDVRGYVQKVCSTSKVHVFYYLFFTAYTLLPHEWCSVLIMGRKLTCNLLSKQKPSQVDLNTHLLLVIGGKQMLQVLELECRRYDYVLFWCFNSRAHSLLKRKWNINNLTFCLYVSGAKSFNLCVHFITLAKIEFSHRPWRYLLRFAVQAWPSLQLFLPSCALFA